MKAFKNNSVVTHASRLASSAIWLSFVIFTISIVYNWSETPQPGASWAGLLIVYAFPVAIVGIVGCIIFYFLVSIFSYLYFKFQDYLLQKSNINLTKKLFSLYIISTSVLSVWFFLYGIYISEFNLSVLPIICVLFSFVSFLYYTYSFWMNLVFTISVFTIFSFMYSIITEERILISILFNLFGGGTIAVNTWLLPLRIIFFAKLAYMDKSIEVKNF